MAEDEAIEDYRSSLAELKFNSKPVINMLTMLAEDNSQKAQQIVQVIENHILQVEATRKLPVLYLIDSICKNLQDTPYRELFAQSIVTIFAKVFEEVDEKTRQSMFKLRQTWSTIFPNKRLYGIDVRVQMIDPAWPMIAEEPEQLSIHVNPKFLTQSNVEEVEDVDEKSIETEAQMRKKLIAKQQELLKLQQQRLEMEQAEIARLEQDRKKSEISRSKVSIPTTLPAIPNRPTSSIHINPAVHSQNPSVWNVQNSGDVNQAAEVKISRDPRVRDPRRANRDPRIQPQTNIVMQQQVIQPQFVTTPSSSLASQTAQVMPPHSSLQPQSVVLSQPNSHIPTAQVQPGASVDINHLQAQLQQQITQQQLAASQSALTPQPIVLPGHSNVTHLQAQLVQNSIQPQIIQPQHPSEIHSQPCNIDNQSVSQQSTLVHPFSSQLSPDSRSATSMQQPHATQQTSPVKPLQSMEMTSQMVSPTSQQPHITNKEPFVQTQQINQIAATQLSPQSKSLLQKPGEPVPPAFLQDFAHKPATQTSPQQHEQSSQKDPSKKEALENQTTGGDESKNSRTGQVKPKDASIVKLGRIPKISDRDRKTSNQNSGSDKSLKEPNERRDRRNPSRSGPKSKGDYDSEKSHDRKAERATDNSRRHKDFGRAERNDRIGRQYDRKNEDRRDKDFKAQSRHDTGDHWRRGSWERERSPRNRSPDRRKRDPDSRSPRKSLEIDSKGRDDSKLSRSRNVPSKNSHGRERRSADKKVSESRQKDRDTDDNKNEVVKPVIKKEPDSKVKESLDVDIRSEKENKLKRKSNSDHSSRNEQIDSKPSEASRDEMKDKTEVVDMDLEVDQDDRISDVSPTTKRLKLDSDSKPKSVASADISELIGGEDQDYRRPLPQSKEEADSTQDMDERMLSPDKSGHVGWSNFKQAHPEEFSYELEHPRREVNFSSKVPLQENKRFQNGPLNDEYDGKGIQNEFNVESDVQRSGFERGMKDMYSTKREFEDTDYRRQPAAIMHSTPLNRPDKIKSLFDLGPEDFGNAIKRFENTPMPKAFSLRKREEVLEEAAKRLHTGEITHEQHQEILKQLSEVYNIQKTLHRRSLDKEFMKRDDTCPDENQQNISPERMRLPNIPVHDQKEISDLERPRSPREDHQLPPVDGISNRTRDVDHQGGLNMSMDSAPFHDTDRLTFITGMWGTGQCEEIVIDRVPYEIRLGAKPRKVTIGNSNHELCADAEKRCIFFDKKRVYNFGDPTGNVSVNGKKCSIFYHGPPKFLWISGEQFEIRLDAPPRRVNIDNKEHSILINGSTEMIFVDRIEMGPFGGPPRKIVIANNEHELRFSAPPRHISIDGKICELNLSSRIPVVVIDGKPHGIRFDGPPVDLIIDDQKFNIPVNEPLKIKLGRRSHRILLGGPAHEIVLGGKWFELKFGGPPKKIFFGNRVHIFQLIGSSPDVKILGEVPIEVLSVENDPRNRMNRQQFHGGRDNGVMHKQMMPVGQGPQSGPVPRLMGPEPHQMGPRPEMFRPGSQQMGPGPRQMGPGQQIPHGPQQMGPGPQQLGPGSQQVGPGPQPMGPGPQQMGPGPQQMGPGPQQMGPGPQQMGPGPQQMGPGPQQMGPGPQQMGPGPQQMGPIPQQMGPIPQQGPEPQMLGPRPQQIGPGPQMGAVPQMGQRPIQMGQGFQQAGPEMQQVRPGFQQQGAPQSFVSNMQQGGPQMGPNPQQMGQGPPHMVQEQQMGQGPPGTQFVHQSVQNPMGIADPRFAGPQNQPGDPRFSGPGHIPQPHMNMLQQRPVEPGSGQMVGNQQPLPLLGPRIHLQNQQMPQNAMNPAAQPASVPPPQLDINALFQKLVSAGIIDSKKPQEEEKPTKEAENTDEGDGEAVIEHVPDISGLELYKLRKQYNGVIQRLYTGIQCSSCGVRFMLEDTEEYREHLDWHFRQNKRNESGAVSKFQSWHYSINEWIQYEEVGSIEERSHSAFFESQKTVQQPTYTAAILDSSNVIKNPPAFGDDTCEICSEPFDQYWDEDEEEWHLKEAVRVDNKTYHPVCYEDVKEASIIETPSPTIEPQKPLQVEIKKEKKEPEEEKEDMGKKIQDQIKKELGMLGNPLQTLLNLAKKKKVPTATLR